jgi:type I restriction enzyme S subunit
VLTANKSFVLGYTSETFGVFGSLPVIIFDDFTTDSKYVTFPFKVKSSAVKILKARSPETNLKFVAERMRLLGFAVGEHKRYYISEYQHVELPTPAPDEQSAIAALLSAIDAELAALEARRDKTRNLKQAMMQELLTGKTRLVPAGAAHV